MEAATISTVTDVAVLEAMEISLAGTAKELAHTEGANTANEQNLAQLVEHIKRITGTVNALEAERKGRQSSIRAGLERMNAAYKALTDPLILAKKFLQGLLNRHLQEQERKAREAAAAANKAPEEAAAQESARLETEARRLASEGKAVEAEAMQAAAEQKLQEGIEAPQFAPAHVAPVAGVHGSSGFGRTNWKWKVTDAALIPREYLIPDDKTISALVKARKGNINIPGIEAYPERTASVR